ncbi:unnamed protein product [Xylocopa violacea]|uniref:ribonuclease H n=1 Tax=Xylocopa violacea TaxID=135666 RepID=A0ABP1P7J9_XYLVO
MSKYGNNLIEIPGRSTKKALTKVYWDELRPLTEELEVHPRLPVYETKYAIPLTRIVVNTEIGIKMQNSAASNLDFSNIIRTTLQSYTHIYTDGSESEQALSTGAACICPQRNTHITLSLNKEASIYAAEATAIIMAIDLAIQNPTHPYIIWTDSLSTVQALKSNDPKTISDHRIIKIKTLIHKYHELSNIGTTLQIYWLPPHLRIVSNEMADSAAREAAKNHSDQHIKSNYSDLCPQLE